jgi:hypothetical protein
LCNELHRIKHGYDFPRFACTAKLANAEGPECRNCGRHIAIDIWLHKVDALTSLPCPHCGSATPTYPAPDWLREVLPNALQIFGGEPPEPGPGNHQTLAMDHVARKPIAMACPQCAGGLLIQESDARVVECRYCKTSVFLPDELWRALHPAKTVCAWTLSYTGSLRTKDELREREEKKRAEREEKAREKAARQQQEQDDRERAREEERQREEARLANARLRRRAYFVAAALALGAFTAVAYLMLSAR